MYDLRPAATDSECSAFPSLVQDIANKMDEWGDDGNTSRIDPFTKIYDVSPFFQSACCFRADVEYSSFSWCSS